MTVRRIAVSLALAGLIAGCTAQQIATTQADGARIANAVNEACGMANTEAAIASPFAAVPQIAGILVFEQAGCDTAQAVSALIGKALKDPSTVAWVLDLSAKLRAGVAQVRGG
jgi:hypothetical protein